MAMEDYREAIMPHLPQIFSAISLMLLFGLVVLFAPFRSSFDGSRWSESFSWSAKAVFANLIPIIITYALAMIVGILVTLFTFGLGVLVFAPYLNLLQYELYDQLSPVEETAEEADSEELEL